MVGARCGEAILLYAGLPRLITYFLVVAISIAGSEFRIIENIQQPGLASCLSAAARRLEHNERRGIIVDKYANQRHDAYEVAVTCSAHRAAETPL